MKKKMLPHIIAVAALVMFIVLGAGSATTPDNVYGDFTWRMVRGGVIITRYIGPPGDVVIPAEIEGNPVIIIESRAFMNRGLTSVTIPDSVTQIWQAAFFNNQLTIVTIPDSVIHISPQAFAHNPIIAVHGDSRAATRLAAILEVRHINIQGEAEGIAVVRHINIQGEAEGIAAAADGTVFIAGNYAIGSGVDMSIRPVYWRDGIMIGLPIPEGTNGNANSIAIATDGTVFIAGNYAIGSGVDMSRKPVYWRDGTMIELPIPADTTGFTSDIAVAPNGEVFVSGVFNRRDSAGVYIISRPVYWRDGTMIELPIPAGTNGSARGIAVAPNGEVFTIGWYSGRGPDGRWLLSGPLYWRGTTRIRLPIPAGTSGGAEGIAVAPDGEVIIAGWYDITRLVYWRGTTRISLPVLPHTEPRVSGMTVGADGTVFIAGALEREDASGNEIAIPVYWRNRTIRELPISVNTR